MVVEIAGGLMFGSMALFADGLLHLWSIGPGIYSAAFSLVTRYPKAPEHYKALVPVGLNVQHVTVEVHRCPDAD